MNIMINTVNSTSIAGDFKGKGHRLSTAAYETGEYF
jgi:hypothetical protein